MLIQQIIAGFSIGSIYVLVAIGYTLIWRALKVLNFSQGDILMLGAYIGYTFLVIFNFPYILAIILSLLFGIIIGLIYSIVIFPLRSRFSRIDTMVVTIAMAIVIRNGCRMIWGAEPLVVPSVFSDVPVSIFGSLVPVAHIFISCISLVLVILLTIFFRFARWGRAMRAAAQDRNAAKLMGIPVFITDTLTFIISTILAVIAGVLISPIYFITTDMGLFNGLKAFLASTIGGLGNVVGALMGGLFLGIVENLASLYISSGYKDIIAFIILIIVLILLPEGFGSLRKKKGGSKY